MARGVDRSRRLGDISIYLSIGESRDYRIYLLALIDRRTSSRLAFTGLYT